MSAPDAIVVGGGVIGASTAFHLASLGARNVLLLEQRFLAAGATGKSGALVRMHYSNLPEARLARQSLDTFLTWSEVVGGSCGFEKCGAVRLVGAHNVERLRANIALLQSVGINTWALSQSDLARLSPTCYVEDVGLAAYEPDSGCADPIATTYGFARRASELGAEIRLAVGVRGVRVRGGRVTGVNTTDGPIDSPRVILATGPWSGPLLKALGVDLDLRTRRIQVAVFHAPPAAQSQRLVYLDGIRDQWIRPLPGDTILAGTGAFRYDDDNDPDAFSETPNQDYIVRAREVLAGRLPEMRNAPMRGGWAGVVSTSADHKPVIDAVPAVEGLFFATADSGSSFKTAPAVGRGLATWALSGSSGDVDLRPFRLSRFAEGAPLRGQHEYDEAASISSTVRPI